MKLALLWVAVTVLAAAAAFVVAGRGEDIYGAESQVLFSSPEANSGNDGARTMATQKSLMLSADNLGRVASGHGLDIEELERKVSVRTGPDAVLKLTTQSADRALALTYNREILDGYVAAVERLPGGTDAEAEELLRNRLNRQRLLLRRRQRALEAAAPTSRRGQLLALQVDELLQTVARLEDRLTDLTIQALDTAVAQVISAPRILDDPLSPRPARAGALGGFLGAVLASGLVALLLRRRRIDQAP